MKLSRFFSANLAKNCFALAAGALTTLAFAPFHFFPIAILTMSVLLALWLDAPLNRTFGRGYFFGVGFFSAGIYWIYISIHTFGEAPPLLAGFITAGLIAILATFPALNGFFLNRFFPVNNTSKMLMAFPAIWVFFEWVRSWIFTGFPWLFLGYSQTNSPLRGFAPVASVYCVSLAILLSSALIVSAIRYARQKDFIPCYSNLFSLALIWIVGAALSFIPWTKNLGNPIKVSLVQGNIPQNIKWSPDALQPTLDTYRSLSKNHWDSKLIIWPEGAVPIAYQDAEEFLEDMNNLAKSHHANFITGIPVKMPEQDSYFNAVIMLGEHSGYYLKRRLVPFGEYVPFSGVMHKMLDILNIPMSNFVPALQPSPPMTIDDLKIGTFICYEIAFPELVLSRDGDINLLLTLSNDAWFGHSIAEAQHLEIGQMRAIEMGRPVLFVSNNGITAVIDAKGNVQSRAPQYETNVLTDTVQPMKGKTPWQRYGMDPILFAIIFMILIAVRERRGQ